MKKYNSSHRLIRSTSMATQSQAPPPHSLPSSMRATRSFVDQRMQYADRPTTTTRSLQLADCP